VTSELFITLLRKFLLLNVKFKEVSKKIYAILRILLTRIKIKILKPFGVSFCCHEWPEPKIAVLSKDGKIIDEDDNEKEKCLIQGYDLSLYTNSP